MKRLLFLILLILCFSADATDVRLTATDPVYGLSQTTNRTVIVQAESGIAQNGSVVLLPFKVTGTTDTNGICTFSNLYGSAIAGWYHVTIPAPPQRVDFDIWVSSTNLGLVQMSTIIGTFGASTYPAGAWAWSAQTSDMRYAIGTNSYTNFVQIGQLLNTSNGIIALIPSTNGFVQSTITNGLATTNFVNSSIVTATNAVSFYFSNLVWVSSNALAGTGVNQTNGFSTLVYTNPSTMVNTGMLASATNLLYYSISNIISGTSNSLWNAKVDSTNGIGSAAYQNIGFFQRSSLLLSNLAITGAFTNPIAAGSNTVFYTNLGVIYVASTGSGGGISVAAGTLISLSTNSGVVTVSAVPQTNSTAYQPASANLTNWSNTTLFNTNGLATITYANSLTNVISGSVVSGAVAQAGHATNSDRTTYASFATNSTYALVATYLTNGVSGLQVNFDGSISFTHPTLMDFTGTAMTGLSELDTAANELLINGNLRTSGTLTVLGSYIYGSLVGNADTSTYSTNAVNVFSAVTNQWRADIASSNDVTRIIATNIAAYKVSQTNGAAYLLKVHTNLYFGGDIPTVQIWTNYIGVVGSTMSYVDGTYVQQDSTHLTNVANGLYTLFLNGGNWYIQSNGVSLYAQASSPVGTNWTLVNGINPVPASTYGWALQLNGSIFLGRFSSTNLTAQITSTISSMAVTNGDTRLLIFPNTNNIFYGTFIGSASANSTNAQFLGGTYYTAYLKTNSTVNLSQLNTNGAQLNYIIGFDGSVAAWVTNSGGGGGSFSGTATNLTGNATNQVNNISFFYANAATNGLGSAAWKSISFFDQSGVALFFADAGSNNVIASSNLMWAQIVGATNKALTTSSNFTIVTGTRLTNAIMNASNSLYASIVAATNGLPSGGGSATNAIGNLNGYGTNTALINLSGITNIGNMNFVGSNIFFYPIQPCSLVSTPGSMSSTMPFVPSYTVTNKNNVLTNYFDGSTYTGGGFANLPTYTLIVTNTCGAGTFFTMNGNITVAHDVAGTLIANDIWRLVAGSTIVFGITNASVIKQPILYSQYMNPGDTLTIQIFSSMAYSSISVPDNFAFLGNITNSFVGTNGAGGMAIGTNSPGTNMLEVFGNVDSTVGFTVNGVPISSSSASSIYPQLIVTNIVGTLQTNYNGLYSSSLSGYYTNSTGWGALMAPGYIYSSSNYTVIYQRYSLQTNYSSNLNEPWYTSPTLFGSYTPGAGTVATTGSPLVTTLPSSSSSGLDATLVTNLSTGSGPLTRSNMSTANAWNFIGTSTAAVFQVTTLNIGSGGINGNGNGLTNTFPMTLLSATNPVPIILMLDLNSDVDDFSDLHLANVFHQSKFHNLLCVIDSTPANQGNNATNRGVATAQAVGGYFVNTTTQYGQNTNGFYYSGPQRYGDLIATNFPNQLLWATNAEWSVRVMRRCLVLCAGNGFLINNGPADGINDLLSSQADDISPLTGAQLLSAKRFKIISTSGYFPYGYEFNNYVSVTNLNVVFGKVPSDVPIIYIDVAFGFNVTALGLPYINMIDRSGPLYMAYTNQVGTSGRPAWGQFAELYSLVGTNSFAGVRLFNEVRGTNVYRWDGTLNGSNSWSTAGSLKDCYVTNIASYSVLQDLINWLDITPSANASKLNTASIFSNPSNQFTGSFFGTALGLTNVSLSIFDVTRFNASGCTNQTTGSISSNSTSLVVADASTFSVGQGIWVLRAGLQGSGYTNLCTTISSISGTTITLASIASNTVSSVRVQHDDSLAINNAIAAAFTNGGGVVYFPKSSTIGAQGIYRCNDKFDVTCNAVIHFPVRTNYVGLPPTVALFGEVKGIITDDALGIANGCALDFKDEVVGTGGTSASIAVAPFVATTDVNQFVSFNNVEVLIDNLLIQTPPDSVNHCLLLGNAQRATVGNNICLAPKANSSGTFLLPTNGSIGLYMPQKGNNILNSVGACQITGFGIGLIAGEHCRFYRPALTANNVGLYMAPLSRGHLISGSVCIENCAYNVQVGTTANVAVDLELQIENATSGVFQNLYDVLDPSSQLYGTVFYQIYSAAAYASINVSGATNATFLKLTSQNTVSTPLTVAAQVSTNGNTFAATMTNAANSFTGAHIGSGAGLTNNTSLASLLPNSLSTSNTSAQIAALLIPASQTYIASASGLGTNTTIYGSSGGTNWLVENASGFHQTNATTLSHVDLTDGNIFLTGSLSLSNSMGIEEPNNNLLLIKGNSILFAGNGGNSGSAGVIIQNSGNLIRSSANAGLQLGSSSGTSGDNVGALWMKSAAQITWNGDTMLYRSSAGAFTFSTTAANFTFPTLSVTGTANNTNLWLNTAFTATNGIGSYASNQLAITSITVGASPFSWTNTFNNKNLQVFVDGTGVSVATAINGTTVFQALTGAAYPVIIQPGEWVTVTYSIGTPVMKWKPL